MLQRVTVNPKASVLAPATYRMQLDAEFNDFRRKTKNLLLQELTVARRSPFLNLHHDGWTTGSGKTGVVGISVRFIDESWCFRTIALLATMSNGSHSSMRMKTLISSRIRDLYDIDIDAMSQFTVSDTAAVARKISRLFEDSVQTDCSMHTLNLCLLYAMGMREHIETFMKKDETTGEMRKVRRVCTSGWAFPEGAARIKKVRAINNYFNSPQRAGRFAKVPQQYGLPQLACIVDCDTRVGSTVTLFTRSIVNITALRCYFEQCQGDDDPAVFNKLSCENWHLLAEMKAIVRAMANLVRAEVQRDDLLSSELTVLIKII
ncbi:hypothetical protein V7S43_002089 [Phytophthora oleae]|uniref:DUF659 domain-containing protein n=1 Tax=Phytophthora oleae TaxID=2107226 RepID=A0ABD3G6P7_9STRA